MCVVLNTVIILFTFCFIDCEKPVHATGRKIFNLHKNERFSLKCASTPALSGDDHSYSAWTRILKNETIKNTSSKIIRLKDFHLNYSIWDEEELLFERFSHGDVGTFICSNKLCNMSVTVDVNMIGNLSF